MKRVVDLTTGQAGTVHWTHAAGWFTPDDGERDALGRVIPIMLDEDMDLVDECAPADVVMGRWSNNA